MRILYLLGGFLFVALAVIGAFLPVMPSTIFIILAAGCFARSSPRLERWLIEHPLFGPALLRWRERGAISPTSKALAVGGMGFGFAVFLVGTRPGALAVAAVAVLLIGCAAYVLTRPDV